MAESKTPPAPEPKAPWFDAVCAILMAVATLATAWCSFQNSRWSSRGGDLEAQADTLERKAMALHLESRTFQDAHLQLAMEVVDAQMNGNEKVARFYTDRFPPELKAAWEKWIALQPLDNPSAPPNPFAAGFYTPRFAQEIQDALAEVQHLNVQAKAAGSNASGYLSNTVLLAMVLFFAGTAGKFDHRNVRLPSLAFAVSLFLWAALRVLLLPVS